MAKDTTAILECTCTAPDQDRIYGKGRRLHNLGFAKGKENGKAYCTVCCYSNRVIRISFVQPRPGQMGPLDKDPLAQRRAKSYNAPKARVVVVETKVK